MAKMYIDSDMLIDVSLHALDLYKIYLTKVKDNLPPILWEEVSGKINGWINRRDAGIKMCTDKEIYDHEHIARLTFEHVFGYKSLRDHLSYLGDWVLPEDVIYEYIIAEGINMKYTKFSSLFSIFTLSKIDVSVNATVIVNNDLHPKMISKTSTPNINMINVDDHGPLGDVNPLILYSDREELIDALRDKGNVTAFSTKEIEGVNQINIHALD